MAAMTSGAPSRSCMSAGCTSPPSNRPVVSVTTCRLRPLIFFAASKPRGSASFSGFDRLAIDNANRGARLPSGRFARLQQQREIDPLQYAAVAPTVEIMLYRRIRRKLARQLPPLAASPHHIEQRIDNAAYFSLRRASQPIARG